MNKQRWFALQHRATSILLAMMALVGVTALVVTLSTYMTNQERIARRLIQEQKDEAAANLRQANSAAVNQDGTGLGKQGLP